MNEQPPRCNPEGAGQLLRRTFRRTTAILDAASMLNGRANIVLEARGFSFSLLIY
jgi:hypothetical protein